MKQIAPAFAAAWLLSGVGTLSHAASRPNIILILADDLGWRDVGFSGNTFVETPHIDRLAREGMRFTQAYSAAPVCSPTRAAAMTGLYPARLGINDYLGPNDKERCLQPGQMTIVKALNGAGYATCLIGKWHLTGDYSLKRGEPAKHGWGEVICSETEYIGPGYYFPPYKHMPDVAPLPGKEYLTDRLNHEAVSFIRRHRDAPFFLFLSHYAVHTALAAKAETIERFARKPGAGDPRPKSKTRHINNPVLAAMMSSVDDGVGQITAALDELGLSRNTLVLFTSDNGGEAVTARGRGVTSVDPLRAGKSHLYEGGIRVPMAARWPAVIQSGTLCTAPVCTTDLFPTFLDAAARPPEPGHAPDGVSLLPAFRGGALPERSLFWHYPLEKPHFLGGRSSGAVRSGNFKFIEFFDDGSSALYDLASDEGERHNLDAQMPERAAALRRELSEWRARVNAEMPKSAAGPAGEKP